MYAFDRWVRGQKNRACGKKRSGECLKAENMWVSGEEGRAGAGKDGQGWGKP